MAGTLEPHEAIKTMKLYHGLERIERRLLHELGVDMRLSVGNNSGWEDGQQALDPELLARVDSLHFLDNEPVRRILELLEGAPPSQNDVQLVLDVGTGYGGTARLLAHRSGCGVHALELQPDMFAVGQALTRCCQLDDKVQHVLGNVLDPPPQLLEARYDAVVGLLSFLHIGSWDALFARCFASLRSGGFLFVEDFYQRGLTLPEEDAETLRSDIYCSSLLRLDELREVLAKSGFRRVELCDLTAQWIPYVVRRADTYRAQLKDHVARDGEQLAYGLDHFYASVARVFQRGHVGGYALVAWKE
jgi:cyclopropane fatty-acyl-phospholipid synthase-like methyltransferase